LCISSKVKYNTFREKKLDGKLLKTERHFLVDLLKKGSFAVFRFCWGLEKIVALIHSQNAQWISFLCMNFGAGYEISANCSFSIDLFAKSAII
jgi:hypothetical protein